MPYTDKQLNQFLLQYELLKSEYDTRKTSILNPWTETDTNIGGGSSSRVGRPTESLAVALCDDDRYVELWTILNGVYKLVKNTYPDSPRMYDKEKGQIMYEYYFLGITNKEVSSSSMTTYRRWYKDEFRKLLEDDTNER